MLVPMGVIYVMCYINNKIYYILLQILYIM